MEYKKYYIAKPFSKANIKVADKDDPDFLGFVKLLIATTHPDREGDTISHDFIKSMQKDLEVNTTGFYNHLTEKRDDLPISKTLSSTLKTLEKGHIGVELNIGISKTAPKIWVLIQEGILNKGSVGGVITDVDYNRETGKVILKSGTALEPSIVGIPANSQAEISRVIANFKKSLSTIGKVNNKGIEEDELNMDKEELSKMMSGYVKDAVDGVKETFEKKIGDTEKVNLDLTKQLSEIKGSFEKEKDELKKQLELSNIKVEEAKKEADEFQKGLSKGRSSEKIEIEKLEAELYKDPKYALAKGFHGFGEWLRDSSIGDELILEGSYGEEGF